MQTPFDEVIEDIKKRGYHNHRLEEHSDVVSMGILRDLKASCPAFKSDLDSGKTKWWLNVKAPGARRRKMDLLVGEPDGEGKPDLQKVRVCVENKSVVTAHRNNVSRFDDLNEALQVLHSAQSEAVVVATVLIGVATRVLNVPDKVKSMYKERMNEFDQNVRPRFSTGDQSLWKEFSYAVSPNRSDDSIRTKEKLLKLPTRPPGHTHVVGYDYVLLVPVYIDNVNPPYVDRQNRLGIDVDKEYQTMLEQMCKGYGARWHL